MEPSLDSIQKLRSLNRGARWAWYGPSKKFALLQLYRRHDADREMYEPWNRRGPIFGEKFNVHIYEPLWLANFEPEDVFGLHFIPVVKRWMTPIRERMINSALDRGKRYQSDISDMAGEMGEKLYSDAQKSTSSPIRVPKKFLTREDKAALTGESMRDVTREFLP